MLRELFHGKGERTLISGEFPKDRLHFGSVGSFVSRILHPTVAWVYHIGLDTIFPNCCGLQRVENSLYLPVSEHSKVCMLYVFLAGINNSPNSYNPCGEKDNTEKIKIRTSLFIQ